MMILILLTALIAACDGSSPLIEARPIASLDRTSFDLGADGVSASANLTNIGNAPLTWSVSGPAWVAVAPASGTLAAGAAQAIVLTPNRSALPPGAHQADLTLTSNGGTAGIVLRATVAPPPASLRTQPATLDFGTSTNALTATIANDGGQALTWSASAGASWVHLSRGGGTVDPGLSQAVSVSVDRQGLATGSHSTTLRVHSNGGEASIAIQAVVEATGPPPPPPPPTSDPVPLTELRNLTYFGFEGGLYPGGANDPPADHGAAGRAALARIRPLDGAGQPSAGGKIALVSVGMSNTTQEFCSQEGGPPCDSWTFMGQAEADPVVDETTLVLVNGARGAQTAVDWDSATDANYDRVRDIDLASVGLTEEQVQIAWVKQANPRPAVSLPSSDADAYRLEASLGRIVRAMKTRWPNLQIVFFSSRIYAGYATTKLNPEPYAYESGFAVKWVIQAQIEQSRTGAVDAESGDVGLAGGAPWLAWGPYLWADGTNPRVDGLVWVRADFSSDGMHPGQSGEQKVGRMLLDFFKTSPFSQCWFLAGRSCS